ncbi:radical SAM protein [candidate division KSB1 bacterium]|nr:radical SAM protein [candidate division KSB1 bacterium]
MKPDALYKEYTECQLCPRNCGMNRIACETGVCGESDQLRVAAIEAHFGEEPPISGIHGSGTVFFSGCSLKCQYCQNHQISHDGMGRIITVTDVVNRLEQLVSHESIHNVNFVTADHFFPHTIEIVDLLAERDLLIPIVYNLSGYQSINSLRLIETSADIYLPDFKYSDADIAAQLSRCRDYPAVAIDALAEMVRQKGFLNNFTTNDESCDIATKGVLVRHLILPGHVKNSLDALSTLFIEFGANLPISLMSQYYPTQLFKQPELNRGITSEEFQQVYSHVLELGFNHVFVQFPESHAPERPFLPDFQRAKPFVGNAKSDNSE